MVRVGIAAGVMIVVVCSWCAGNPNDEGMEMSGRLEELERELVKAQEQDNRVEIAEIRELMENLTSGAADWDDTEPPVDLRTERSDVWVAGREFALRMGMDGHVKAIRMKLDDMACTGPTVYRINRKRARVVQVKRTDKGIHTVLEAAGERAKLSIEGGSELSVRVETQADNVTFGFGLPTTARFHVTDGSHASNIARVIDEKLLVRSGYGKIEISPQYQLILAELRQGFVSISGRSDYREPVLDDEMERAAHVRLRHRDDDIVFEWTWRPQSPLVLSYHETMEGAAAEYRTSLSFTPLKESPQAWVEASKLLITLDMWRSNGDIAHSYQHAIDLAKDLYTAGARGDILFYIPGWCGMYDAAYPDYTPKNELGGAGKFREMIETFHKCGYRVMIHVLPWGGDPFGPEFDQIKHMTSWQAKQTPHTALLPENEERARKAGGQVFPPVNWPACYPAQISDYDSGRHELVDVNRQGRKVTFKTADLPRNLECHLTLGGIRSPHAVTVSTHYRSWTIPAGHFEQHDSYAFPYTFLQYQGENHMTLQFDGPEVPDLSRAWYRLHECLFSEMIWTYPILGMDTGNPEWIKLVTDRVIKAVRQYNIDAVHVDADFLWSTEDLTGTINGVLKAALPDVAFSTEKAVEPSMMMFQLAQTAQVPFDEDEEFQHSKLAELIFMPYRRQYLHLCGAQAFVPFVTVCTIDKAPPPLDEGAVAYNRRLFDDSPKFGVLPNIRVNYRDFGLDEETRRAVLSLY